MCGNGYALSFQNLSCSCACKHNICRKPARKMTAAPNVVTAAVFQICGIICVSGTRRRNQISVIRRASICIMYNCGKRCACCFAVKHAGEHFGKVCLFSRSSSFIASRSSPAHLNVYLVHIYFFSAWKSVNNYAHSRAVTFSEYGYSYFFTKKRTHSIHLLLAGLCP